MYLELAENGKAANPYIWMPDPQTGNLIKVREDYFDYLPEPVWLELMDMLEKYQPDPEEKQLSGLFGCGKRCQARLERKKLREQSKADARATRTQGFYEIRSGKGAAFEQRWNPETGAQTVGQTLTTITGQIAPMLPALTGMPTGQGMFPGQPGFQGQPPGTMPPRRPVWPWVIGGLAVAGTIGYVIYSQSK